MSVDTEKPTPKNAWIIALLVSITVNGLFAGLLLSKQVNPRPTDLGKPTLQSPRGPMQTSSNDPKHLVRALSPERRKQVMVSALKNLTDSGYEHPRRLFKRLRKAKYHTMQLLRADKLDTKEIEQSLADVRAFNQKLAVSGDALMIEILNQLTPEERKAARKIMKDRVSHRKRLNMERH